MPVYNKTRAEIYNDIYQEYLTSPMASVDKDKVSRLANKMAVQLTWRRFTSSENKKRGLG